MRILLGAAMAVAMANLCSAGTVSEYKDVNGVWRPVRFHPPVMQNGRWLPSHDAPCGRLEIPTLGIDQDVCRTTAGSFIHEADDVADGGDFTRMTFFRMEIGEYDVPQGDVMVATVYYARTMLESSDTWIDVRRDGVRFFAPQWPDRAERRTVPLTGDFNADMVIDAADAGIMFAHWGHSPTGEGDLSGNHDWFVDAEDAGIMFANWTADAAPVAAAVPEPASILSRCGSLALLLASRWLNRSSR